MVRLAMAPRAPSALKHVTMTCSTCKKSGCASRNWVTLLWTASTAPCVQLSVDSARNWSETCVLQRIWQVQVMAHAAGNAKHSTHSTQTLSLTHKQTKVPGCPQTCFCCLLVATTPCNSCAQHTLAQMHKVGDTQHKDHCKAHSTPSSWCAGTQSMPCRCCNQQADSVTPPTHRCYPLATECITARHPVCATGPSSARSVDRVNLLKQAVTCGLTNQACVEKGDTNAACWAW